MKPSLSKRVAHHALSRKYGRNSVSKSQEFLIKKRLKLKHFPTSLDFCLASPEEQIKDHSGFIHHMNVVRYVLAQELRENDIFIGESVIDELLFHAIAHKKQKTL